MARREPSPEEAASSSSSGGGAGAGGGPLPNLVRLVMPQFVGMELGGDAAKTRKALLDFSYHLALGDMDAAYRAVKLIRSPAVWESMAHMCIKVGWGGRHDKEGACATCTLRVWAKGRGEGRALEPRRS